MAIWVERHGKYQCDMTATALVSSNAAWIAEDNIFYHHLLPGTEVIASATLPSREKFDFSMGKIEAFLWLFGKDGILEECPITVRLYVDRLVVAKQVIDPFGWEPNIVHKIPLGNAILTRDEIMIVRVEREGAGEGAGEDTIGVLACSFVIEGGQE